MRNKNKNKILSMAILLVVSVTTVLISGTKGIADNHMPLKKGIIKKINGISYFTEADSGATEINKNYYIHPDAPLSFIQKINPFAFIKYRKKNRCVGFLIDEITVGEGKNRKVVKNIIIRTNTCDIDSPKIQLFNDLYINNTFEGERYCLIKYLAYIDQRVSLYEFTARDSDRNTLVAAGQLRIEFCDKNDDKNYKLTGRLGLDGSFGILLLKKDIIN